jgi:hypothetical protein
MDALLSCPFCDEKATYNDWPVKRLKEDDMTVVSKHVWNVSCTQCKATTKSYQTGLEAKIAWNNRKNSQTTYENN